jgi:hypothetical protein
MGLGSGKTNAHRKWTGGGPRPDRATDKREDAAARNEAWAGLTPERQLAALDRRLGRGVGARKQRARLAKAMRGAA